MNLSFPSNSLLLSFSCIDNCVVNSLRINRYSLIVSYWLFIDILSLPVHKVSTEAHPHHAAWASDCTKDVKQVTSFPLNVDNDIRFFFSSKTVLTGS